MSETTVEQILARDGQYLATPVGISMWPMLHNRHDAVLIVALGGHTVKRGDVILYRRPTGKLVLHRVRGHRADGDVLCGDNLAHREFGVQPEWILGVASGFYRGQRFVPVTHFGYRVYVQAVLWTLPLRAPVLMIKRGEVPRLFRRAVAKAKRILKGQ